MREETMKLMEDVVVKDLEFLRDYDEYDENAVKMAKDCEKRVCNLTDRMNARESMQMDFWEKADRRESDEKKNQAMIELEEKKMQIPWWRTCLDMAKIVVPVVVPIMAYNIFQERVLKFEETGRITSTAGRDLHLPRFMK